MSVWKMFLIHDIPRWPYSLGMLNCLYHSPVNFSKGSMESFFTCAHFCPTYGEVTLQCQNITFLNGSDDGEMKGQIREIWYAYHLFCIIFIFYLLTPFINPLTPNDSYNGRTAPLPSKRYILYIYSTNTGTEYFKHGVHSPFFPLQNAVCFINLTYLVPVLFTVYVQNVLKLKK